MKALLFLLIQTSGFLLELARGESIKGAGFYQTQDLSSNDWTLMTVDTNTILKNQIQCASFCSWKNETEGLDCNAFSFDKTNLICEIANLAYLEEIQAGVVAKVHH